MLPERRMFDEEECPVPDSLLGQLYRASPHGLDELITSVPPSVRGMLAVYCYRRAHLASIGLAIAATCDEDDLERHGGNAGSVLFAKSRQLPEAPPQPSGQSGRRKVTLASGTLRNMIPAEVVEDEQLETLA